MSIEEKLLGVRRSSRASVEFLSSSVEPGLSPFLVNAFNVEGIRKEKGSTRQRLCPLEHLSILRSGFT